MDFIPDSLKARLLNLQTPSRAYRSGQFHYDIGNDLYQSMLDDRLIYTAGYWKNASSLDEAQENKLEWVGRRLRLQPGMRVLDIGCGWGGTAKFLAERYNVQVVGITVAKEQVKLGKELCRDSRLKSALRIIEVFMRPSTAFSRWVCSNTWVTRTIRPLCALSGNA